MSIAFYARLEEIWLLAHNSSMKALLKFALTYFESIKFFPAFRNEIKHITSVVNLMFLWTQNEKIHRQR